MKGDQMDALTAKALFRVVKAIRSGHCPNCDLIAAPEEFREEKNDWFECPSCGFNVTTYEASKIIDYQGDVMRESVRVFEHWRANGGV